jgi:hypothetical protein
MIAAPGTHRSQQTRRSLVAISLTLATLLAIFFYTQVLNGHHYRVISDASRAAHTRSK